MKVDGVRPPITWWASAGNPVTATSMSASDAARSTRLSDIFPFAHDVLLRCYGTIDSISG